MNDVFSVKLEDGSVREFMYSPEFRTEMKNVQIQLKRTHWLLLGLLAGVLIAVILMILLITQTGIVGRYLLEACKIL